MWTRRRWCASCGRSARHDPGADVDAGLAGRGPDRHAQRLRWPRALVQEKLKLDAHSGQVFVLRGKRGDLIKLIWWDGQGLCLFSKRLEKGRFVWPSPADVAVHLTPAQLAMLLEGIDWRMPQRTWRPEAAG